MSHDLFIRMGRPFGEVWLNAEKPIWIVEYPETHDRARHFQVYKPVVPVPKGRDPWTVDNKRIGDARGFKTLSDAMGAAV